LRISKSLDNQSLYRTIYLIRRFEEKVLDEFPRGRFYGTTHTYIGQEANAVGVLSNIQAEDIVVSNHRCHGHFLAYGGDIQALFAELMGKETGVCAGRGGSQHLYWNNFYTNGILGGTVPVATGMALAEKYKKSESIAVNFIGDGAFGEGVVYESLNMASLWAAPILYIIENNHIAQTTPIELNLAGNIATRFEAFDIPTHELSTSDVLEIGAIALELIREVRTDSKPHALIIHTHRFGPHSKGDDTRDPNIIAKMREVYDPVEIHGSRLSVDLREKIEREINNSIDQAFQAALDAPSPKLDQNQIKI
jgi:TPP-dependent pyruvate/acetoin dehydrogenase alpha subunit